MSTTQDRGELAGTPNEMPCWGCGTTAKAAGQPYQVDDLSQMPYVMRVVTALGPVTNRADPTQTYRLACGHITI